MLRHVLSTLRGMGLAAVLIALVGCSATSDEPSSDAATTTCATCPADAGVADACVHASASATCCEGAQWSRASTACGGKVRCAIWYTCKGGIVYDDADNCHFMPCP